MGLWPFTLAAVPGTLLGFVALESTRPGPAGCRGRWAAWAGVVLCGSGLIAVYGLVVAWGVGVIP